MSTTVTYKGQTLTTVENQTKTLNTAGTWVEGDFTLTDVTQGGGGEWTTEGIANSTEPNGAIVVNTSFVKEGAFQYCTGITSVDLQAGINCDKGNVFRGCTSLQTVTGSGYCRLIWWSDGFRDCTALKTVNLLNRGRVGGSSLFNNCTALEEFRAPYVMTQENGNEWYANDSQMPNSGFRGCTSLKLVDYGHAKGQFANCFINCTALRTLILRRVDSVCEINAWSANAMGGIYNNPTESTIYVPQALISSYQTATNWSTGYAAGLTFLPIEGSEYEL